MPTGLNFTGKSVNAGAGVHGLVEGTIQDNYGTAIGNGDPVTISSGYVIRCPESAAATHVLRGIKYVNASGEVITMNFYPGGITNTGVIDGKTEVVAILEPVGGRRFLIDASGSVTQATIGTLKRLTLGTVNASTGRSQAVVNIAGSVTTELLLVRVLGLAPTPTAAFGSNVALEVEIVDPDAVS